MTTVTMPVEELAKLVKHADNSIYMFNLFRYGNQYHRCLKVILLERDPRDPEIGFELTEDQRVIATVTYKLTDIFELLPRLSAFLAKRYQSV